MVEDDRDDNEIVQRYIKIIFNNEKDNLASDKVASSSNLNKI